MASTMQTMLDEQYFVSVKRRQLRKKVNKVPSIPTANTQMTLECQVASGTGVASILLFPEIKW